MSRSIVSEIGIIVDIYRNRVQINPKTVFDIRLKDQQLAILRSKTNEFMRKFSFCSIPLQQATEQLVILRAQSSIVAFGRNGRDQYSLVTKTSDMEHLMQKLRPNESVSHQSTIHPSMTASTIPK